MSKNSASIQPLDIIEENDEVKVDVQALVATKKGETDSTPSHPKMERQPSKLDTVDTSKSKIRMMCASILLEKSWWVLMTMFWTMYALFGDDIRLASSDKPADILFYILSFVALLVFIVELFVTIFGQPYYFDFYYNKDGLQLPSFYFWLDVAATVSLYPDVIPLFIPEDPYSVAPSADAVKAGRASRAGTRAGRIIRLVRIVRMVKLVKAVRGKGADKNMQEQKAEPSAVGTKLSEVTIRKVIMIVLLSIIVLPILDGSLEGTENLQHVFGLQELHRIPQDRNTTGDIPGEIFAERVRQYGRDVGKVVHIKVRRTKNCCSKLLFKMLLKMLILLLSIHIDSCCCSADSLTTITVDPDNILLPRSLSPHSFLLSHFHFHFHFHFH